MIRIRKCLRVSLAIGLFAASACAPNAWADPPGPKAGKNRLLKLGKALPTANALLSVIETLDEATRRDYVAVARVVETGFEGRTSLVIGTVPTQIETEKRQDGLRGEVRVRMQVPADATVSVDLDALRDCLYFNVATKTVEVSLPPLKIIAVEPHLHKAAVFAEYPGWARFSWWDSCNSAELEHTLLRTTDWGQLVRNSVNPNASHLRAAAAHEVRVLLRHMLEPTKSDIKVEVRP